MTMAKKLVSVAGTRCANLVQASATRDAERLLLDDSAELGAHRLRRLVGDDSQRVAERQTGAHAAHDDVERGGQRVNELLDAPCASAARARDSGRPTPTVIATSAAINGLWVLK